MTRVSSNKRRKLPATRIGKASVGRILLILMENLITSYMSAESMRTTMQAVYAYLQSPDVLIDGSSETRIFTLLKNEIDLSFDRSQKARARAALRKAAREAETLATIQATSRATDGENHVAIEHPVPVSDRNALTSETSTNTAHIPSPTTPAKDETTPSEATMSAATPDQADEDVHAKQSSVPAKASESANSSSGEPIRKRRPVRDPDAPAFTYRPPAPKPTKAYVIT